MNMRHQGVVGDDAEAAGLIVVHRLLQFLDRVHDERSVLHDRFADRPATEQ